MDTQALWARYRAYQAQNFKLDLSRGKPSDAQLALSKPMLENVDIDYTLEDGGDARNYGHPTGIPEAKRLFGAMLGVPADQVIAGGNSSLQMICDALTRALLLGPLPGDAPWSAKPPVRFICPVPGYDWHFHMLNMLGIEAVPVPLLKNGDLDMERVEALARDPQVRGMICVPMYGNPSGQTFSAASVARLARMETAAPDFRIFWDHAYCVHHLDENNRDAVPNLLDACGAAGCPDRALLFTSFSKITYPGGGMAAMACSPRNMARQSALTQYQHVNFDSMNQLRHVRFLPDLAAVQAQMRAHAAILAPKFQLVLDALASELSDIADWTKPRGGYFICFNAPDGCAKRIVRLCAEAGVVLTPAGAPFPGGFDPRDRVIRLAPSYPPLAELERVMEVFALTVRIAATEASRA